MRKPEYLPCIPTRGTKVSAGPDWLHVIKDDGYRLTVQREGFAGHEPRQGRLPSPAVGLCADYRCTHHVEIDGDRCGDEVRLSDLDPSKRPIPKSLINLDQPPSAMGGVPMRVSGGFLELATCLALLCSSLLVIAFS